MQEKELTTLALIAIFVGLVTLYFVLPDKTQDSSNIIVKGSVDSVDNKEKISLVRINLETPLTIISFQKQEFNKGDKVTVTGKLQQYRGKIELLATTIQKT